MDLMCPTNAHSFVGGWGLEAEQQAFGADFGMFFMVDPIPESRFVPLDRRWRQANATGDPVCNRRYH